MNYKYKRSQLFGKRLNVPKNILRRVYNSTLSINEYIQYQLDDKIPTTCIDISDRELVDKFGIEKLKSVDWELINSHIYYSGPSPRQMLIDLSPDVDDINDALYEQLKDKIDLTDYTKGMKEKYSDRFFKLSEGLDEKEIELMTKFNNGRIELTEIIKNWELFREKDLSYCLSRDKKNTEHISDEKIKSFMSNYRDIAPLIVDNDNIYAVINTISESLDEIEKKSYLQSVTDKILDKTMEKREWDRISLTNEQFKTLFKYSSVEDYLKKGVWNDYDVDNILKELQILNISTDYLFEMSIPFTMLKNTDVLHFLGTYGLKNVVDFDNECEHFFTNNDCSMLKMMYDMYMHYANNEYNPQRTIFTQNPYDENGNYVERPYTKDEFYEAMKRMIVYGPTDCNYADKAPDYRNMRGEFKIRNQELFISDDAPEELQHLFYTKSITPDYILEHSNYIQYLKGKDLSSCFRKRQIRVADEKQYYDYENIYKFLSTKTDFNGVMNFIMDYSEVLDTIFDRTNSYSYQYEINFSSKDDMNQISERINNCLRKLIIEKGVVYPNHIPQKLLETNPTMFLPSDAPNELKEAFYNRTITTDFILSNPTYRQYIEGVDLEFLFKYMPVNVKRDDKYHENINLVNGINNIFGKTETLDVMLLYGSYIEKVFKDNGLSKFNFDLKFSKESLSDELDNVIFQNIIDGNMIYDEKIPKHFKDNHPTMFLANDVSQEIKDRFYNRKFTIKDFNDKPELFEILGNTNIACGFPKNMSWIIPLFKENENFKKANLNRLKVISAYSKIQDLELQRAFKEYVMEFGTNIDIEKIEYVTEVLSKLSLSNSSEIFTFRKELATQILKSNNPLESLSKIEDIFIRNNIPTVGKIYSCFEILHPDFEGFNMGSTTISPVLKKSSNISRKVIVFSDLIKSSFGSNNRAVNEYLKNIELGSNLYESIKNGHVQFDSLDESQKQEMITFSNHLATLYNNTMISKKNNKVYNITGNVLKDIHELSKRLSPNGTLDYNLGDRVIRMFCGFAGIDTLEQAKDYIEKKIKNADSRNRIAGKSDVVLEQGDFVKGIGGITYLRNILQNGSVSKEYLGSSAGSDATPLDTDVSMILNSEGTINEKINSTAANSYGPIWFVLKNDDRFSTTRTIDQTLNKKRDLSKMEAFYTGVLGDGHYGIRTGFASSEINYIIMDNYDPRVGLEIAMNGFYIPVANREGKIIFTPEEYDKLREKMNGLSYYNCGEYKIDKSIYNENPLIDEIEDSITLNQEQTNIKSNLIFSKLTTGLEKLNISLNKKIDLSLNSVTLFNTGSTGRFTNLPGDGDFDFVMQVDREYYKNPEKMNLLRKNILESLGGKGDNVGGDIRELKTILEDEKGVQHELEIDITFVVKTDKTEYASDVCVSDRLNNIKDEKMRNRVKANIIFAKKFLKGINAYKPSRKDANQGGMGGIGVENWILQNGGTFENAAKSFLEASSKSNSFEEFKNNYKLYNFVFNHMAEKSGQYSHDDYI